MSKSKQIMRTKARNEVPLPTYHTKMHQRPALHQILTYTERTVSFGNTNCQKFPQNKTGKNRAARPQAKVTTFIVNISPIKMLPGTTGFTVAYFKCS